MEGELELVAWVIYAIFKKRPSCAYAAFATTIVLVLGVMLIGAQDPGDRTFPILGLVFVFSVVLGQIIRTIRQQSVRDFQVMEDTPLEPDPPAPQVTGYITLQSSADETPPEHKPAQRRSGDHMHKVPATRSPVLVTFLQYLSSGPGTIRKTLAERGLAEASIAASKFSGALFLLMNILSIALAFAAFPCLLITGLLLADPKVLEPLMIAYVIPYGLTVIIMLLSALAALGLPLVAFFTRAENKSRAALALLISVLSLIAYTIVGLGVLAFSE